MNDTGIKMLTAKIRDAETWEAVKGFPAVMIFSRHLI